MTPILLPFPTIYNSVLKTSQASQRNHLTRQAFAIIFLGMNTPKDLITATEAHRLLETSPNKIAELIRKGLLQTYHSPLDRRKKLVSKAEVLRLREPRAEAA
jgi:DNA-binding MarR family transcriptional regulator